MKNERFKPILADTWWFGLTRRMPEERFRRLAELRSRQGFNTVQLVVGIPPEVGPTHVEAQSEVGPAYSVEGEINSEYLRLARSRIVVLNECGLTCFVYGGWGHQIAWFGVSHMVRWWDAIISNLSDLDVVFCLCGEINLWPGREHLLFPDRSTGDLFTRKYARAVPNLAGRLVRNLRTSLCGNGTRRKNVLKQRKKSWSTVLRTVTAQTDRPVIIHPCVGELAADCVDDPELLAVNAIQTGHEEGSRGSIWQIPTLLRSRADLTSGVINLEPWYEGIRGRHSMRDQLFAYWAGTLAGGSGFCYGAQGVWNAGDGRFLAHWGIQTYDDAICLKTPELLAVSHELYLARTSRVESVEVDAQHSRLRKISEISSECRIDFIPAVEICDQLPRGMYFLPTAGKFVPSIPREGSLVVIQS